MLNIFISTTKTRKKNEISDLKKKKQNVSIHLFMQQFVSSYHSIHLQYKQNFVVIIPFVASKNFASLLLQQIVDEIPLNVVQIFDELSTIKIQFN
jgi:hypothetical protein